MGTTLPLLDLTAPLPHQLTSSLANPSVPIRVTVATFLSLKNVLGNEFPRACQLKNTIDQVGDQQQQQLQLAAMNKSHGHGVIGGGKILNRGMMEFKLISSESHYILRITEDELCALMLNSEYVLVKIYAEYGLRQNPFLIRWIELYQWLLDTYVDGDYGDDGRNRQTGESKKRSEGELRLVKVRAAFIEAILNEVNNISKYTPKEYITDATHYPVDLSKFDDALIAQNIYSSKEEIPWNQGRFQNERLATPAVPSKMPQHHENRAQEQHRSDVSHHPKQSLTQKDGWRAVQGQTPPPGLTSRSSYTQMQAQQPQQRPQQAQSQIQPHHKLNQSQAAYQAMEHRNEAALVQKLIHTLTKAQVEEVSDVNLNLLLQHFSDYPHHLFAAFDPSDGSLNSMVQHNPKLAEGIIQIFLLSTGRDSSERKELLQTMQRLPVTIGALDTLNHIVQAAAQGSSSGGQALLTKQEADVLLHGFLANAMLLAESLGANVNAGNALNTHNDGGYLQNASGVGNGLVTPGGRMGNAPNLNGHTGYQARSFQHRMVQLLCLFVASLINSGVIRVDEYYYEIQELGVRYIFVKEARELWQRVKTGKI